MRYSLELMVYEGSDVYAPLTDAPPPKGLAIARTA